MTGTKTVLLQPELESPLVLTQPSQIEDELMTGTELVEKSPPRPQTNPAVSLLAAGGSDQSITGAEPVLDDNQSVTSSLATAQALVTRSESPDPLDGTQKPVQPPAKKRGGRQKVIRPSIYDDVASPADPAPN
jgi:hypothetical protein